MMVQKSASIMQFGEGGLPNHLENVGIARVFSSRDESASKAGILKGSKTQGL